MKADSRGFRYGSTLYHRFGEKGKRDDAIERGCVRSTWRTKIVRGIRFPFASGGAPRFPHFPRSYPVMSIERRTLPTSNLLIIVHRIYAVLSATSLLFLRRILYFCKYIRAIKKLDFINKIRRIVLFVKYITAHTWILLKFNANFNVFLKLQSLVLG